MANAFDAIEQKNNKKHIRYNTGRLFKMTGSTIASHPILNIDAGLDIVDTTTTISGSTGGSHSLKVKPQRQTYHITNTTVTSSTHTVLSLISPETAGTFAYNGFNEDTDTFEFDEQNVVYLMRIDGEIPTVGVSQEPVFHIDLATSGSISTEPGAGNFGHTTAHSVNRQTDNLIVKTEGPTSPSVIHFHSTFMFEVDADFFVSGVQLYVATSDDQALEFNSASCLITRLG